MTDTPDTAGAGDEGTRFGRAKEFVNAVFTSARPEPADPEL